MHRFSTTFARMAGALAITLTIAACSSNDATSPTVGNGSMSATVAGTPWTASLTVQATNAGGMVSIAGQDNSVRQIQLRVMSPTSTGTYNIGAGSSNFAQVSTGTNANDTYSASLVGGSGTVTFDKLSATEASGTFSFTGMNTGKATTSVTNGKFSVTFKN